MIETVYINGYDIYRTWGARLEDGSKAKLIMGLPLKEFIENKSPFKAGKEVNTSTPLVDERDIELVINFSKPGNFVSNHASFMKQMYKGAVMLRYVDEEMDTTFILTYLQCRSLATVQYAGRLSVRFNEPNPRDRQ